MSDPTIYLAGPVAAYDDGGREWRDWVQDQFPDIEFKNPLAKYNVPLEELTITATETAREDAISVDRLVESDKRLLRESDALLVGYSDVKSIGTPMEVMWARERDYPVALWIRDDTDFEALSPWYRHHVTACTNDVTMAIGHLTGQLGGDDAE
ncbi:MAG: hypothetical protein ACOCUA_03210 [archaeon]